MTVRQTDGQADNKEEIPLCQLAYAGEQKLRKKYCSLLAVIQKFVDILICRTNNIGIKKKCFWYTTIFWLNLHVNFQTNMCSSIEFTGNLTRLVYDSQHSSQMRMFLPGLARITSVSLLRLVSRRPSTSRWYSSFSRSASDSFNLQNSEFQAIHYLFKV